MEKVIFEGDFLNSVSVTDFSQRFKYRIRKKGIFKRKYTVSGELGLADERSFYQGVELNAIVRQGVEIDDGSERVATISKITGQFIYKIMHKGHPDLYIDLGLAIDKEIHFKFSDNEYNLKACGKKWELKGEHCLLCQFIVGVCYIITFAS